MYQGGSVLDHRRQQHGRQLSLADQSPDALGNGADDIRIESTSGVWVDIVRYDDGPRWPDSAGMSISLDPSGFDRFSNDDPAFWCHSTSVMAGGDTGTPGAPNDGCP